MCPASLENTAARQVLLLGSWMNTGGWANAEVTPFILIEQPTEDGRAIELWPLETLVETSPYLIHHPSDDFDCRDRNILVSLLGLDRLPAHVV